MILFAKFTSFLVRKVGIKTMTNNTIYNTTVFVDKSEREQAVTIARMLSRNVITASRDEDQLQKIIFAANERDTKLILDGLRNL